MKKITAVFYEYPAALHDIKLWESLKKDDITQKYNLTETDELNPLYIPTTGESFMYMLKPKKEDEGLFDCEVLIATPIQKPIYDTLNSMIQDNYYYKTLIFGKVTTELLKPVISFMEKCETIKQNYKIQI